jgi:hypothetical protein
LVKAQRAQQIKARLRRARYALLKLRFDRVYLGGACLRHAFFAMALMISTCVNAQDANLVGAWLLQSPQLWQQLELNQDGTYQRSIVSATSQRTEIGRWHSDVSVLVLQPDHVITTQGARVPLPPRDRQIDVAGVDANSLTLYYDGDAVETWQRLPHAAALPAAPSLAATTVAAKVTPAQQSQLPPRKPRTITLPTPQVHLMAARIDAPVMPDFLIAARPREARLTTSYDIAMPAQPVVAALPEFSVAAEPPASAEPTISASAPAAQVRPPASPVPAGLYPEASVVELITQVACEELRYPQRDPAASLKRYQQIAQSLGFESGDPVRLQRTLRFYQSNADFLRAHQRAIAENSMRCVTALEQVSTRQ